MNRLRKLGYLVLAAALAACCAVGAALLAAQEFVAAWDTMRSRDWVRVSAEPTSRTTYRYTFAGGDYAGHRLGPGQIGTFESSRHDGLREFLAEAQQDRRKVSVWVDPDWPVRSMLERRGTVNDSLEEAVRTVLFALVAWFAAFHALPGLWRAHPDEFTHRSLPLGEEPVRWMAGAWIAAVLPALFAVPVTVATAFRMLFEGDWRAFADLFFLPVPAFAVLAVVILYARHRRESGPDEDAEGAAEAAR